MRAAISSAYEYWTWHRCRERILSLKSRLGFGTRLWVLGFELLDDGRFIDPFHAVEVFDPARAGPARTIPARYSAVPEMYCLLSTYSAARETPLSGEWLSPAHLDPVHRQGLPTRDCKALLAYVGQDLVALRETVVPFFGPARQHGDLTLEVWPLPRVPVQLTLWRGDDEVADGGVVLFDRSVTHYLPGLVDELAALTVWRLCNILDFKRKWGYHGLAREG